MSELRSGASRPAALTRVLAATDLSSRSDRALRRAAMLAKASGAELLVLHAVDDDQPRSLVEAERQEASAILREQVVGLPELRGAGATPMIEEGDPFETILRFAETRRVDIVVVGEHRRRPLQDIFSGTTAERVMRHGRHPVLMVNKAPAGPYRHVLVATDLSAHSAHAIRAAQCLTLLGEARLTLLYAFEPASIRALSLADAPPAAIAAHEAEAGRKASSQLGSFVAALGLPEQPAQQVAAGDAASIILDFAARLRPDLLVIGTAGFGLLRRAVIGSVAAEVLGAISCDALAVPPEMGR